MGICSTSAVICAVALCYMKCCLHGDSGQPSYSLDFATQLGPCGADEQLSGGANGGGGKERYQIVGRVAHP